VQERLGKWLSACDVFPLRDDGRPQPKVVEVEARQHKGDVVSRRTTSTIEYLHCAREALTLPIPLIAHPTRANLYHKPSNEPKHLIEGHYDHNFPSTSRTAATHSLAPLDVRQWLDQEAIDTKMTSTCQCLPGASEAIPASIQERCGYMNVSKMNEATLMPCSPRAESSDPSTSGSPASPNNGLIFDKVISQPTVTQTIVPMFCTF
jgi:hypothetical protein